MAVVTSPPRNSVWDIVCSFIRPGGNRVCKLQPTPQALYEEKKSSPSQPLAQMTVIRKSHHSRPGERGDVHGNWRHYMKPHCVYKKKKSKTPHRRNQRPSPSLNKPPFFRHIVCFLLLETIGRTPAARLSVMQSKKIGRRGRPLERQSKWKIYQQHGGCGGARSPVLNMLRLPSRLLCRTLRGPQHSKLQFLVNISQGHN